MKNLLPLLLLIVVASTANAQRTFEDYQNNKPSFGERIFFGGGLGFGAGNGATSIQVNPIVGYMITQRWSAGVGLDYQYIKYKDIDFEDNLWGGQFFTRYNIRMFFAHAEYNIMSFNNLYFDGSTERQSASRFLLGGGISQPLGRRGAINLAALYDLMYENSGPFGSPWVFRIYFSY